MKNSAGLGKIFKGLQKISALNCGAGKQGVGHSKATWQSVDVICDGFEAQTIHSQPV